MTYKEPYESREDIIKKDRNTHKLYEKNIIAIADSMVRKAIKVDENLYSIPDSSFNNFKEVINKYNKIIDDENEEAFGGFDPVKPSFY